MDIAFDAPQTHPDSPAPKIELSPARRRHSSAISGTARSDAAPATKAQQLKEAIWARNDGRWLTRKQFWLLRSRCIDPMGPSDDEHSTKEGWDRWRERVKGLNSRNYPFAPEPESKF